MEMPVGRNAELTKKERASLIDEYRLTNEPNPEIRERYFREEGRKEGITEGWLESFKEGLSEGRTEGRREARIMIAKTLMDKQMHIDDIAYVTGLGHEDLEHLWFSQNYRSEDRLPVEQTLPG